MCGGLWEEEEEEEEGVKTTIMQWRRTTVMLSTVMLCVILVPHNGARPLWPSTPSTLVILPVQMCL